MTRDEHAVEPQPQKKLQPYARNRRIFNRTHRTAKRFAVETTGSTANRMPIPAHDTLIFAIQPHSFYCSMPFHSEDFRNGMEQACRTMYFTSHPILYDATVQEMGLFCLDSSDSCVNDLQHDGAMIPFL